MKICSKTQTLHHLKKFSRGNMHPNPLAKKRLATPRVAIKPLRGMPLAQRPKKFCPPWQILHTPVMNLYFGDLDSYSCLYYFL